MYVNHSRKYARTSYAVHVGGRWVMMAKCECGSVHLYWVLEKEPGLDVLRLDEENLTDEIRNHLLDRLSKLKPEEVLVRN